MRGRGTGMAFNKMRRPGAQRGFNRSSFSLVSIRGLSTRTLLPVAGFLE
jgi:hypothetical protein